MDDAEFSELAERTQQLVEVSQTLGWKLYEDRARVELAKHQHAILNGQLDHDRYQRECGWLDGAVTMLGLPAQAQKELQDAALRRAAEADEQEAAEASP